MTWADVLLLVAVVVFLTVGTRYGGLWTAACLVSGFAGAYLVDYYAVPLGGMMGGFWGAHVLAGILLFLGAVGVILLPGLLLSHLTSVILLGFFESLFGLFTGLLAGGFAITVAILFLLATFPRVERSNAWQKSMLVKPLANALEEMFQRPRFQPRRLLRQLNKDAREAAGDAAADIKAGLKDETSDLLKDAAKKIKN